jgi:hypothetical protein
MHHQKRPSTLLSEPNNDHNFQSFKYSPEGKRTVNQSSPRSTDEKAPSKEMMLELQSQVIQKDNEVG